MTLPGWTYYADYTTDINVIDSDQTNYVAQIYMSGSCGNNSFDFSDIFIKIGVNYKKVAFEFNDSGVECYAENAQWDSAAKLGLYNVRIPNIYASTTITIRVYYDPAHADNTTYIGNIGSTVGETVYDSNFTTAHQMANDPSGTPPQLIDSTPDNYDATSSGAMTATDLVDADYCGKGQELDGINDFFTLPSFDNAIFTVEAVVKFNTLPTTGNFVRIISKYLGSGSALGSWNINIVESGGNYLVHMSIATGSGWTEVYLIQSLSVGTTYYFTGVADGTNFRIYLGEVQLATTPGYSVSPLTQDITIGADNPNNRWVDGVVSLVRVSSVDRGSDWVKTTNASFFDNLFSIVPAPPLFRGPVITPNKGVNQRQLRNFLFNTVIDAEAAIVYAGLCYIYDTRTVYEFIDTSTEVVDHTRVLSTGLGGDSRWLAIAGDVFEAYQQELVFKKFYYMATVL